MFLDSGTFIHCIIAVQFSCRIKKIENISHLVKLRELYLGKNKITKIEGLETLKELRLLSLPVCLME